MGLLLVKLSGKGGKEVAEQAAKQVAKAAPEAATGLRGWWKSTKSFFGKGVDDLAEAGGKTSEEIIEGATKNADEILHDMSGVRNLASKSSKEITETINSANKELSDGITSLNSSMRSNAAELDRIHRNIAQQEKLEPGKQIESVLDALRERRAVLDKQVSLEKMQLDALSDILKTSITPGQEKAAIDMLGQSTIRGMNSIPHILEWQSKLQSAFRINRQIMNMTSKNLGSNTAFLQEFLSLNRNPLAAEKLALWGSNPSNFSKLEQLMQRDKIFDIITKGKMSIRDKLLGITPADTAKRLGITAAAVAASAGAIKIYDWFDGNNPEQIASNSQQAASSLGALKTSGDGIAIAAQANNALNNMAGLANTVNGSLSSENAPVVIKDYIEGMNEELANLSDALTQWKVVIENSEDKAAAAAMGNELLKFAYKIAQDLGQLGSSIGVNLNTASLPGEEEIAGIAGKGGKGGARDENIIKIQGFMKIPETGELDRQTITTLRNLEQDFNRRAGTIRFTGAFVVPEVQHVVPYEQLIKAYQKVQKY